MTHSFFGGVYPATRKDMTRRKPLSRLSRTPKEIVIPLIMMTSYAEIQTAVQAIKLGASDYIAKPLNPEELLGKIKDVIKAEAGPVASAAELSRPVRSAKSPEPSGGTHCQYYVEERARSPVNSTSMCVWLLQQICLYWLPVRVVQEKNMLPAVFMNRATVGKPLLLLSTVGLSQKIWPRPNFSGM